MKLQAVTCKISEAYPLFLQQSKMERFAGFFIG